MLQRHSCARHGTSAPTDWFAHSNQPFLTWASHRSPTWKRNQQIFKVKVKQHWKSSVTNRARGQTWKDRNIWKNNIFHYILLKKVHKSVFWLQELSSSQTPIKYKKSEQLALIWSSQGSSEPSRQLWQRRMRPQSNPTPDPGPLIESGASEAPSAKGTCKPWFEGSQSTLWLKYRQTRIFYLFTSVFSCPDV